MSYRPTWRQTIGRTLVRVGLGVIGVGAVLLAHLPGWVIGVAPVVVLLAAGLGAVLSRTVGVDADELGLHPTPGPSRIYAPWSRIVDIRPERRRGATVPVVYWDSGAVWRLRAPYDGRWLARDPEFEQKIFAMRNLWETRRVGDRSDR